VAEPPKEKRDFEFEQAGNMIRVIGPDLFLWLEKMHVGEKEYAYLNEISND
jgi:hypothetical protein